MAYKRLTPKQLASLGLSPKSRRYIEAGTKPTRYNTISARQYEQQKNSKEYGEKVTKEQRTKRLRLGEYEYRSKQAFDAIEIKAHRSDIRRSINRGSRPYNKRDIDIIYKKLYSGVEWHDWSEKDRKSFSDLWDELSPDEAAELRKILSNEVMRKAA